MSQTQTTRTPRGSNDTDSTGSNFTPYVRDRSNEIDAAKEAIKKAKTEVEEKKNRQRGGCGCF